MGAEYTAEWRFEVRSQAWRRKLDSRLSATLWGERRSAPPDEDVPAPVLRALELACAREASPRHELSAILNESIWKQANEEKEETNRKAN